MKFRERIEEICILLLIIIIILPLSLLYLLFKLLITPYDYIIYKRSRYQKDFPHKYTWLSTPHMDNKAYTAIKENDLPVEYIKWREDYDLNGFFVYKNILLDFNDPFFFDEEKKIWLCWMDENEEEEQSEYEEDTDEETNEDNTDDCLTVEETEKHILEEFHINVSGRVCNRVVFFCERKHIEKNYGEEGLQSMLTLDNFVVYEKGQLAKAIKDFIEKV